MINLSLIFFGGVWDSNPKLYIYYALSLPIELSSLGESVSSLKIESKN